MAAEDIQEGDIVRADEEDFYNDVSPEAYRKNGACFAELATSEPDGDNDLKCHLIDMNSETIYSDHNYVDASSFWKVQSLPNEGDEEIEKRLDNEDEEDESRLAVLDERKENLIQMQEIKSRTIAPDVLELDVKTVISAENSNQWAIIVGHPSIGEMKFYEEKPVTGWSEEYRIVRLLKSYGIYDGNPYKLQRRSVFVEFTGQDPSLASHWRLLMRDEVLDEYGDVADDAGKEVKKEDKDSKREIPLLNRFL